MGDLLGSKDAAEALQESLCKFLENRPELLTEFALTGKVVVNPQELLDEYIKDSSS